MFKQKITPIYTHRGSIHTAYVCYNNYSHIKSIIDSLLSSNYIPRSEKYAQYNYTSSTIEVPILFFTTNGNYVQTSENLYINTTATNYVDTTAVSQRYVNTSSSYSTLVDYTYEVNSYYNQVTRGRLFISNGNSQSYRKWRTSFYTSVSDYTPRIKMVSDIEAQSATFKLDGGNGTYKAVKFYFGTPEYDNGGTGRRFNFKYDSPVSINTRI